MQMEKEQLLPLVYLLAIVSRTLGIPDNTYHKISHYGAKEL
jgi:hypothetical protein